MNSPEAVMIDGTSKRSAMGIVVDALANAVARCVNRIAAPKLEPTLDFVTQVLPIVPALLDALKPRAPLESDGPAMKQARRELAAEEARLHAEHDAHLAAVVANFGPRFIEAAAADDVLRANGEPRDVVAD